MTVFHRGGEIMKNAMKKVLLPGLLLVCTLLSASAFADVCAFPNNCPGAPVTGFLPPTHYQENVLYTLPAGVTVVPGDVVMCEDGSRNLACFNTFDPTTG